MTTSLKQSLIYVLLSFILIGVAYLVFVYESPITVVHEQHIEIERNPSFVELLGEEELTEEEFKGLKLESYNHWVKANAGNELSLKQWEERFGKNQTRISNP